MAQLMILLMRIALESNIHISNSLFFPGGALVALVAISSCANHVTYWAAFLIGCLAGKKLYISTVGTSKCFIHKCSTGL